MLGSVTRQKVCQPLAPSDAAPPPPPRVPCACISGISSRATNGKVTNIVASTMPGTAKMILMSCSCEPRPEPALRPNSSTKIRPEITGETANGRSISVISRLLPRNSNLAIAQAAARPKTRLSGTAIAATSSVSRIAASASGSVSAGEIGAEALGAAPRRRRRQRQQQEQAEERERGRDQDGQRTSGGSSAVATRLACAAADGEHQLHPPHQPCAPRAQRCSRLIASSSRNEATSITTRSRSRRRSRTARA